MSSRVKIIGAGLAGSEAAWQCARRGIAVDLYEMRPVRRTPAHETDQFAELVCSNSLKSDSENTAPWLLKEEMRRAGSLLMRIAAETSVPAGHALAVDRDGFARGVTESLEGEPLVTIHREEVTGIDEHSDISIVATGPLTSDALSREIARLTAAVGRADAVMGSSSAVPGLEICQDVAPVSDGGSAPVACASTFGDPSQGPAGVGAGATSHPGATPHLYFFDSISPIVEADSIDMGRAYMKARYDKGTADYINCPFTKEEYDVFYDALVSAESVQSPEWEKLNYFEGCLPIEEIARRGRDTLRFGPMKPVGLRDPRTGQTPYAVAQLRQENLRADSYNIVGFQNHLKFGEQARILRLIPGLENAKFLRYGQIHRNTYINSPALLTETLQMKRFPRVLFAGQISGVEGYVEAIATGLMAGIHAAAIARESAPVPTPRASAFGSLVNYICRAEAKTFQPANITFDLLPPWETKIRDKKERHRLQCERALREFEAWGVWSLVAESRR